MYLHKFHYITILQTFIQTAKKGSSEREFSLLVYSKKWSRKLYMHSIGLYCTLPNNSVIQLYLFPVGYTYHFL